MEAGVGAELDIPEFSNGVSDYIDGLDDMIATLGKLDGVGGCQTLPISSLSSFT